MNTLDKQYTDLLQDILDNGITKQDRTGTSTTSVFGRQIRHDMKTGFPLITTKKMAWKTMVTELLWFLRGDTNIKFLVDNGCSIWNGDAFKNYISKTNEYKGDWPDTMDEFIERIKADDEFAKKWGSLGSIYGKQWRNWGEWSTIDVPKKVLKPGIDQIQNLINDLKTNPDSRRLMVNAWNVGELDQMVLPPCHYGFQVYTRELSESERFNWYGNKIGSHIHHDHIEQEMNENNVPKRAISLMWNQRSVDTFLGLPFNIASYGLLLEIIATSVNMVPDELIGQLGDVHLYNNHIEQAKEQIGRELSAKERTALGSNGSTKLYDVIKEGDYETINADTEMHRVCDEYGVPRRTRQPYPLPALNINTEFWPYEGGSCGEGPLDAVKVFEAFKDDNFCKCLLEEDIQLSNYQYHPTIKAPLSN
jgi:thymidylate synthase